jgi:rubrerythrin
MTSDFSKMTALSADGKPQWKPSAIKWRVAPCGHWVRSDRSDESCSSCEQYDIDRAYIDEMVA